MGLWGLQLPPPQRADHVVFLYVKLCKYRLKIQACLHKSLTASGGLRPPDPLSGEYGGSQSKKGPGILRMCGCADRGLGNGVNADFTRIFIRT